MARKCRHIFGVRPAVLLWTVGMIVGIIAGTALAVRLTMSSGG